MLSTDIFIEICSQKLNDENSGTYQQTFFLNLHNFYMKMNFEDPFPLFRIVLKIIGKFNLLIKIFKG